MIYTVGNRINYEKAIQEYGKIYKKGKSVNYGGGIVFETKSDAERYLLEDDQLDVRDAWCVWGVDAVWNIDTEPATDGWWHYLMYDSYIIVL